VVMVVSGGSDGNEGEEFHLLNVKILFIIILDIENIYKLI
jgi:hypothetical protein